MSLLTTPTKKSYSTREEEELFAIAQKIIIHPKLNSLFRGQNIKKIIKKYY